MDTSLSAKQVRLLSICVFSIFQSDGKWGWNMRSSGLHIDIPQILQHPNIDVIMTVNVFRINLWIIFNLPVFENFTVDRRLSVKIWTPEGSLMSFFIKERCLEKKEVKKFCLYLKLDYHLSKKFTLFASLKAL